MDDERLVEIIAKAMWDTHVARQKSPANWMAWDEPAQDGDSLKWQQDCREDAMASISSLRAAGYTILPPEGTPEWEAAVHAALAAEGRSFTAGPWVAMETALRAAGGRDE